jgi:hypothetical protein
MFRGWKDETDRGGDDADWVLIPRRSSPRGWLVTSWKCADKSGRVRGGLPIGECDEMIEHLLPPRRLGAFAEPFPLSVSGQPGNEDVSDYLTYHIQDKTTI